MAENRFIPFLGIGAVGAVFAIAIYFIASVDIIERDEATLCRKDGIIPQHDIVLMDATNKLPLRDIEETRRLIGTILQDIPIYGKLTIVSFAGGDDFFIKEMFSLCNPGRGNQFSSFSTSQRRAQANWDKTFGELFESRLKELEELPEADTTPLLESLETISRRRDFRQSMQDRDNLNQEPLVRRLFIISDLFQYRPGADFYRKNLNLEAFSKTSYFNQLHIDLTDIDVIIFQILRAKPEHKNIQINEQPDFWREMLGMWNAKSIKFY